MGKSRSRRLRPIASSLSSRSALIMETDSQALLPIKRSLCRRSLSSITRICVDCRFSFADLCFLISAIRSEVSS